jgi:hypothetical protein
MTVVRTISIVTGLSAANVALADSASRHVPAPQHNRAHLHRYLIERTFPAHALDGFNADSKASVNAINAKFGVRWVRGHLKKEIHSHAKGSQPIVRSNNARRDFRAVRPRPRHSVNG